MIKINLLPQEGAKGQISEKAFKFEIPEFGPKVIKAGMYALSILIGLHLLLGVSVFLKGYSLKRLESRWGQLGPNRTEIETINKEIASIEKTVLPMRRLVEDRMLWSKELNQFSSLMTPGVWVTKLYIQTQIKDVQKGEYTRLLILEGAAASLYGDEAGLIAKFVKAMQDDKEFFQYFSEVKLGPMEKTMLEKIPVMNFKLSCVFKK